MLFAEWDVMEYRAGLPGSVRLGPGELHHLGPLLGFVGEKFAELGGRAREYRAAHVGKARADFGVGQARIDLFVELVDDLGGRVLWRPDHQKQNRPPNPPQTPP